MTVRFFYHTPMPANMNERRAFCRIARLLYRAYGRTTDTYFLLANVEPREDHWLRGLTQLDAVLFGPKLIAIIDFKNSYDPFDARDLKGSWVSLGNGHIIYSGQNKNPFQQAMKARHVWSDYLVKKSRSLFNKQNQIQSLLPVLGRQLQSFVLVYPLLHPDCKLPTMELRTNHKWFHLRGIDDILELTFSNVSDAVLLPPEETEQLIRSVLFGHEWSDMDEILHHPIGSLCISEPNRPLVKEQLFNDDEFTIGRSHTQRYQLSRESKLVSAQHARIEVNQGNVTLFDAGSKNGTYVNAERVDSLIGVELVPGLRASLGRKGEHTCQLWFEPVRLNTMETDIWLTNDTGQ